MKEVIDNTRLISNKHQPPNLKRILTEAAFHDKPSPLNVRLTNVAIKDVAVAHFSN